MQCPEATILHERIDSIVALIPDGFPIRDALIRALRGRQDSIAFTAPRAIADRWQEVAEILVASLPDPDSFAWAKEIEEIFSTDYQ
jgi:hypothetical protein